MPRYNEEENTVVREQVKQILYHMIHDELDILSGCRELSRLHLLGHEFIPLSFVAFDSQMDHLPLPAHYHLWNPDSLAVALKEVDTYKKGILAEAEDWLRKEGLFHPPSNCC